jgi:hypothetical protein
LDELAGLSPSSPEFRRRFNKYIVKRKELDELQEIARVATRAALEAYEPIPPEWEKNLTLGTLFEGDDRVFELYVAGERPRDAIVLTSARVNRLTRSVSVQVTNLQPRKS